MVERVLLVMNRSSGTGHGEEVLRRLQSTLVEVLGRPMPLTMEVVSDHPQAKACAQDFLGASPAPAVIVVGGGGGTLRAVIEGICAACPPGHLPARERVRLAALRMGSGNVVAKQFGVSRDFLEAIRAFAANLLADRTAPCCVIRCELGSARDGPQIRYAVTMVGLGQFGRAPGDLSRWHRRLPLLRALLARVLGLEELNDLEYALALLLRSGGCALRPDACERVEVRAHGRSDSLRLLAGVVMNFPIAVLPFDPGVGVEDPAVSLHLIPYPGRLRSLLLVPAAGRLAERATTLRIDSSDCVEIRWLDRQSAEVFLDEDPEEVHGHLTLQIAGTLAFVPGSDYRWPGQKT